MPADKPPQPHKSKKLGRMVIGQSVLGYSALARSYPPGTTLDQALQLQRLRLDRERLAESGRLREAIEEQNRNGHRLKPLLDDFPFLKPMTRLPKRLAGKPVAPDPMARTDVKVTVAEDIRPVAHIELLRRHIEKANATDQSGWFKTKAAFYSRLHIDKADFYAWARGEKLKAPTYKTRIEKAINALPQ